MEKAHTCRFCLTVLPHGTINARGEQVFTKHPQRDIWMLFPRSSDGLEGLVGDGILTPL